MSSSYIRSLVVFTCGLYIGKHYPQYVPLPQLTTENIQKALNYLETMERRSKS